MDSREVEEAGLRTQERGTQGQLDRERGRRKKTNQVKRNSGECRCSKAWGPQMPLTARMGLEPGDSLDDSE